MTSISAFLLSGCGQTASTTSYVTYQTSVARFDETEHEPSFYAEDLCVTDTNDIGTDQVDSQVAEGAGVFNLDTREVTYAQNLYGKLYPASTTKILTAYIIIQNCNLSDMVTVSQSAMDLTSDSSLCGLQAGDTISVRDLLYGLMLASGNDAAVVLAEYYSGSVEAFADVMNAEALKLGATNSHFVNPNGLPDDDHYTTIYDMYLIFQEAIQSDEFVTIIGSSSYEASYTDAAGNPVTKTWNNTNRYLSDEVTSPDGITVIGGKTGTTNAAGYCLVLYSTNASNQRIISIVYKADGRSNLYLLMNEILDTFAK